MPSNTQSDARNGKSKKRSRVRLSKLYSYTCARPPRTDENHEQAPIGSAGFSRVVFCNEPERHKIKPFKYKPNYVSTTKYNILTFFPKALFEQFRRVANFYFLFTAAMSLTSLSPSSPVSSILPLVAVIGISMIKEAIEDWNRFVQDRSINGRTVKVHVGDGKFVDKEWKNVQVGDVVQVQDGEFFPADLLMISSHYEDGICYVETMNLDGETNLKVKKALEATTDLETDDKFGHFTATIRCEDPNPELYTFVGNLEYDNTVLPIGPQQVLLRDSKLRNTQYIYGVVIFSGHDTKVMQNATDPPSKRSRIERKMDSIIYFLFAVMVAMSLIGGIVLGIRTKEDMPKWWYLRPDDTTTQYNPENPAVSGVYQFITDIILYAYLIPISLYISLEVVKIYQVRFINKDRSMYHEETDKTAHARTSNLNEDLGQVDTILSDKTGTLTCNQMDFLKCSIAGVSYGTGATEVERATAKRLGHSFHDSDDVVEIQNEDIESEGEGEGEEMVEKPHVKGFRFEDERIMNGNWRSQPQASMIQMFFRILAICHTAIPEEEDNGRTKYEAESPDEAAFVIAAREIGFEFVKRTQTSVFVRELDPTSGRKLEREYKVLNLLEFNSTRKRMTVIVQDEDAQIYVFCKGADSVIFERLSRNGREFEEATKEHLDTYADSGLRTLTLAYKKIDEAAYQRWNDIFIAAQNNLSADRESKLDEASDMIENNLILVGATAVEDKLQKGVPECIDKLALAGLKIWVLTGDKMETAINIGFACSLLRQDMEQIVVTLDLPNITPTQDIKAQENNKKVEKDIITNQITVGLQKVTMDSSSFNVFALIIDGKSLAYALQDDMKDKFLQLAVKCASVICCRVSPKQKAMVTKLVKKGTGKTTLAIGDGANDVGMIQEADIGVGISGVEGMQAVMASDFSIAQFRFLERLLIVHGHWCYKRISTMICYFFYKNIVFGLTLFYFQAYTNFSGQTLYNDWYSTLFNIIFTSLPICVLGILEQDVPAKVCLEFPSIYQQGPKNMFFTWARILGWQVYAVLGSILCFFLTLGILGVPAFRQNGQVAEFEVVGATMYSVILWVLTCQIALTTNYFTYKLHKYTWGSIAAWYIFLLIYGIVSPTTSTTAYKVLTEEIGPAPSCWAANLLVTVACLFPYFVFTSLQRRFWPMDHHILQEMVHLNKREQDPELWSKEKEKAVERTNFGFTARLRSRINRIRRKHHHHHRRNPYSQTK